MPLPRVWAPWPLLHQRGVQIQCALAGMIALAPALALALALLALALVRIRVLLPTILMRVRRRIRCQIPMQGVKLKQNATVLRYDSLQNLKCGSGTCLSTVCRCSRLVVPSSIRHH